MSTLVCFALKEEAAPFRKIAAGKGRLKIAQRFSAGIDAAKLEKVPSGTKEMFYRPWRDLDNRIARFPAINGWAILKPNPDFQCLRH
jgi:hypothetical protein